VGLLLLLEMALRLILLVLLELRLYLLALLELLQVEDDRAFLRRTDFLPLHKHTDESESLLEYSGLL
jgi:hypothetical protein